MIESFSASQLSSDKIHLKAMHPPRLTARHAVPIDVFLFLQKLLAKAAAFVVHVICKGW